MFDLLLRRLQIIEWASKPFRDRGVTYEVTLHAAPGPQSSLQVRYGHRTPSGMWAREPMRIKLGNWRERRSLEPLRKRIARAINGRLWAKLKEESLVGTFDSKRYGRAPLDIEILNDARL